MPRVARPPPTPLRFPPQQPPARAYAPGMRAENSGDGAAPGLPAYTNGQGRHSAASPTLAATEPELGGLGSSGAGGGGSITLARGIGAGPDAPPARAAGGARDDDDLEQLLNRYRS